MKNQKNNHLLKKLFKSYKSKKDKNFNFPLLNNGYSKKDLIEGAKTLISGNLTMAKKQEFLKNILQKK